jgi:hypothetical protein
MQPCLHSSSEPAVLCLQNAVHVHNSTHLHMYCALGLQHSCECPTSAVGCCPTVMAEWGHLQGLLGVAPCRVCAGCRLSSLAQQRPQVRHLRGRSGSVGMEHTSGSVTEGKHGMAAGVAGAKNFEVSTKSGCSGTCQQLNNVQGRLGV